MPQSLKLVLFDCDGTLVDGQHAIVAAMDHAWKAHGLGEAEPARVRRVVGLPLLTAILALRPDLTNEQAEAVADSYREAFFTLRSQGQALEPLFPGVREALDALGDAGVLLGVATGKSKRGLLAVLKAHGLLDRFVTLQTSDFGPGKPAPDMVFRALDETGVDPSRTVVVGDTTFDIQMARAARVGALGVSWGYHEVAELVAAGAHRIVDAAAEVPAAALALLQDADAKEDIA